MYKRLAIDFDDTIVTEAYPNVGRLKFGAKFALNNLHKHHKILINTCRNSQPLENAKEFLHENNIKYDEINENDPTLIYFFRDESRKISADYYIDDKNFFGIHNLLFVWLWFTLKRWFSFSNWKKKPLVFAIVGESGTGKTTLSDHLWETLRINPIYSYTERPKRTPRESGHIFLTPERFSGLNHHDLLASTIYNNFRYCSLFSDLEKVNTYVVDENGLKDLERFKGTYYNLVSIRLWRTQHARQRSGVQFNRMKRDEGRFNRGLNSFDHTIIDEDLSDMINQGTRIIRNEEQKFRS